MHICTFLDAAPTMIVSAQDHLWHLMTLQLDISETMQPMHQVSYCRYKGDGLLNASKLTHISVAFHTLTLCLVITGSIMQSTVLKLLKGL